MQYIVGLTGLIGSGKSLAAKYFQQLGAIVIDTDIIAHEITKAQGSAINPIKTYFGQHYILPNGDLDRVKMRQLVFTNSNQRLALESILHPLIFNQVLEQIQLRVGLYYVVVVPLLFRSPQYLGLINRSIMVDCNIKSLMKRIKLRNGFSFKEIQAILAAQVDRKEQLKLADDILYNNKSKLALFKQVQRLDKKYKTLLAN